MRKPKPYDYSDPRPPSRSQKKRDSSALQVLGGKLAELPDSALKRLAKDNLSNLFPHPLYVAFHYSHPPLLERISRLMPRQP